MSDDLGKNKISFAAALTETLRDNALQTTFVSKDECPDNEYQSHGDCASCGFKCARALNPIEQRGSLDSAAPPSPETTFPLPQILIALSGFIIGCLLSQVFLKLFQL